MKTIKYIIVIIFLIGAGLSGCQPEEPQATEVISPTEVSATAAPEITEEPPTPTPVIFSDAELQLDGEAGESEGPWLLLETSEGLKIVDANASVLGVVPIPAPFTSGSAQPAPSGGLVGFVFSNDSENFKGLQVYSFTENRVIYNQDLLAYDGESLSFENTQAADEFNLDRETAVGRLAWSSDGKQLAFISSHMGPTPDVYVLDIETGEVTQITSLPTHEVNLAWSPDDAYIFIAAVEKLNVGYAGTGFSGWEFYAARPDGTDVIDAGEGLQNRGWETMVGWYADTQVLMVSGYGACGMFDLRILNIESGEYQMVWEGQIDEVSYAPESKRVLVWQSALPQKPRTAVLNLMLGCTA